MNEYVTNIKTEKTIGTERRLRAEITISHDYDFDIIRHLTSTLGFDVETERVQTSQYDGELHIKVFEIVKREMLPEKRY
jgi:hypothetical protein